MLESRPGHQAFNSNSPALIEGTTQTVVKKEEDGGLDVHNYEKRLRDALEKVSYTEIIIHDSENYLSDMGKRRFDKGTNDTG